MTTTRVCALQMQGKVADIQYNLAHVRELLDEAVRLKAQVVAVPEFFTTPIVEDPRLWACSLPPDNPALDLLRRYALDYGLLIGGSYLEKRGEDVFNCYVLVHPDGSVTRHDKDRPTMIENAYYIGGQDPGIHESSLGTVGTAVCWETMRTQTVRRLRGRIDFVMSGSHWWSPPLNWPVLKKFFHTMADMNADYLESAPGTFARLLGVSNIHASHCGPLVGKLPLLPPPVHPVAYRGELMGEAQIIDNRGQCLARRQRHEGPGVIHAELELVPGEVTLALPDRFWIPRLKWRFRFFWHQQNLCSRMLYHKARRAGWLSVYPGGDSSQHRGSRTQQVT
ncbi:carbon-nitrogen hydrolase family protein [Marinobacteraceae bacterium S3BR75-40.1]